MGDFIVETDVEELGEGRYRATLHLCDVFVAPSVPASPREGAQ